MLTVIGEILDVPWRTLHRAQMSAVACADDGCKVGAISRSLCRKRCRRSDFLDKGRDLCSDFWHTETRLDTNLGHKKRQRVECDDGRIEYLEHWRHVQYDTNEQLAESLFDDGRYHAYLREGNKAFGRDVFYEQKCFCIEQPKFEECTCPPVYPRSRDGARLRSAARQVVQGGREEGHQVHVCKRLREGRRLSADVQVPLFAQGLRTQAVWEGELSRPVHHHRTQVSGIRQILPATVLPRAAA